MENFQMLIRYAAVIVGTYLFRDSPEAIESFAGLAMCVAGILWALYARVIKAPEDGKAKVSTCGSSSPDSSE